MATQRYRKISYAPLEEKFTETSCTVDSIDLPNMQRSYIASVQLSTDKAPVSYQTSERKEIVDFSVVYIPHDNSSGRALLPYVKKAVEAVLEKSYSPKTATIEVTNGTSTEQTIQIDNCIVTAAEIQIDLNDYLRIKFDLQGILNSAY